MEEGPWDESGAVVDSRTSAVAIIDTEEVERAASSFPTAALRCGEAVERIGEV